MCTARSKDLTFCERDLFVGQCILFFQELAMGGSYRRSGAEPSFCVLGSFRCDSTQTAGAGPLLRKGFEFEVLLRML